MPLVKLYARRTRVVLVEGVKIEKERLVPCCSITLAGRPILARGATPGSREYGVMELTVKEIDMAKEIGMKVVGA